MAKVSELMSSRIGNTITNVRTWNNVMYNVDAYGILPDGTDQTAKLQALIDLAISEGRKAIFFPHGDYYVTSLENVEQVVFFGDNARFIGGYDGVINQLGDDASSGLFINILDFGAKGDGITDDSGAFEKIEDMYDGKVVYLNGNTYKVSSFPRKNRYVSGFFKIDHFVYPAQGTIDMQTQKIVSTKRYASWPQDKAHFYNGVIYAPFLMGDNHTTNKTTYLIKSYDGGISWTMPEVMIGDLTDYTNNRHAFCAGVLEGGRQIVAASIPVSLTDHNVSSYHLYWRRLPEWRIRGRCLNTTQGSATVVVNFPNHGLITGEVVNITGVGQTVGGLSLSGDYTTTRIDVNNFSITASSAATSTENNGGDDDIYFVFKQSDWTEILFNGQNIGDYLQIFQGIDYVPDMIHSFQVIDNHSFYTFVSGPTDCLIKVSNLYDAPSIDQLFVSNYSNTHAEGSVRTVDENRVCGFLRSQNAAYGPVFWVSTNLGVTATEFTAPIQFGLRSNVALEVVNNTIYAFLTERSDNDPESFSPVDIDAYLLVADVDEAFEKGWEAFEIIVVGKVHFSEHRGDSSGAGVPSMVRFGDRLLIFYGNEETTDTRTQLNTPESPGSPDIFVTIINIGNGLLGGATTQETIDKMNATPIFNALPRNLFDVSGVGDGKTISFMGSTGLPTLDLMGNGDTGIQKRLYMYRNGEPAAYWEFDGTANTFRLVDIWHTNTVLMNVPASNRMGIFTTTNPSVEGLMLGRRIYPDAHNTQDIGTNATRWRTIYAVDITVTNQPVVSSDERIKEDIADETLGLSFIEMLRPVQYRLSDGKRTHHGLIAQQFKSVIDELGIDHAAFVQDEEGFMGIRYGELMSSMIKAIQELSERVKQLERR